MDNNSILEQVQKDLLDFRAFPIEEQQNLARETQMVGVVSPSYHFVRFETVTKVYRRV